ncbi:DUF7669 domain-containing protein [Aneurinibacillus soli]|uniref:DUF7669 domain-containing protein n=1 Tax=Aneurinibacillus soli TaxID=1500254 RepID=UPI004038523D
MANSCRAEILATVHSIVRNKGINEFTVNEVVEYLSQNNTVYKPQSIRTHITSRCCVNAPDHHAVVYDDFERIGRGVYKLRSFII